MAYYLIIGMTYAFAAAIQHGPLQSYLISQTLSNGWRRTLPAAFAPLISDGPIIVIFVIVLSRVPIILINVLQCTGGFFLLHLAVNAWKSWKTYNTETSMYGQSSRKNIIQAALVNFLSPGPYLGWSLVLGPNLLKGWSATPLNGISLLVGFYVSFVINQIGIILLFSYARKFGPRVTRILIGWSVVVLAGFGVYQLWSGGSFFLQSN
jgi:threonine/homoserine/homoserine lactone efflux protein